MQIAVCDDDKMCLLELKEQLLSLPYIENVFPFSDLKAFLFSVEDGNSYDAVLMDIDWEQDSTGMDTAAELYKRAPEIKVIYVTGHSEKYSQHVFLHNANLSGFISKPVDVEILKANLKKVADAISFNEQPILLVRQQGSLISIPHCEIYFIESWKHTVMIHSERDPIISYERLDKIMESLSAEFYQCHKSYIVNMRQIRRFQSDEILLKNGKVIPVSRSKYNEAKGAYLSFIGKTF